MRTLRPNAAALLAALGLLISCAPARAAATAVPQDAAPRQAPSAARADNLNHEVVVQLLLASNEPAQRGALPQSLDGVVRQLRGTFQFTSYRPALTLVYRVKDDGTLDVRGVGPAPPTPTPAPSNAVTTYQLQLTRVKLEAEPGGAGLIVIRDLRFSLRLPLVQTRGEGAAAVSQLIGNEDTGISTQMSMREGEPTVVSTLTTSRPDAAYVLVMTVRRAGR
jgi:hypothetical protein